MNIVDDCQYIYKQHLKLKTRAGTRTRDRNEANSILIVDWIWGRLWFVVQGVSMHSHRSPFSMQDLPTELTDLSNAIARHPESFALGNNDIRTAALTATKFVFDTGN